MAKKINVLIPTDFTENANNALQYGLSFISKLNCELFLQHVFEPYEIATEVPIFEVIEKENEEKSIRIKNELQTACEYIQKTKPGQSLDCIISKGDPADEIIAIAKRRDINLIIMGNTIKPKINLFILGNLTNKIIERSPCPVLIIPHNASFREIKKMAYAAILTETEIWKVNQLTALARVFNSDVHIVHISSKEENKTKFGLNEFKAEAKRTIQYEKLFFESISEENLINGIQNYIHEKKIDLISMSIRTRMGLQKLFTQSNTEKVSSRIDIPILVFHYEKNE